MDSKIEKHSTLRDGFLSPVRFFFCSFACGKYATVSAVMTNRSI